MANTDLSLQARKDILASKGMAEIHLHVQQMNALSITLFSEYDTPTAQELLVGLDHMRQHAGDIDAAAEGVFDTVLAQVMVASTQEG